MLQGHVYLLTAHARRGLCQSAVYEGEDARFALSHPRHGEHLRWQLRFIAPAHFTSIVDFSYPSLRHFLQHNSSAALSFYLFVTLAQGIVIHRRYHNR